jgi:hypothetical protein
MALFDTIRAGSSGVSTGYQIERSLRMDGSNGYLTRTPTSTGNRKIWTWSGWVKRGKLDNNDYIFSCNSQSGNDGIAALYWKSGNNKLQFYFDTSGANPYGDVNDRDYRDVGAWYHIVWQVDAGNTTHRIWVNGVEENITGGQPPDYEFAMNRSGYVQAMGTQGWDGHTYRGDMYFAECHYSDGYKYAASDFGEINSETGVWSPKEEVNINYGTNGFYLKFEDNSNNTAATIGKDSSGNGNNWTPNGIVVGDAVKDTPTNNFCTLNPLNQNKNRGQASISRANLRMTSSSGNRGFTTGTMKAQGKIYFEVLNKSNSGFVGISEIDRGTHQSLDFYQGTPRIDGSAINPGTGQFSSGDIMGVKVDIDAKSIEFFRNGSSVYSTTYTTDAEYFPFIEDTSGGRSTDAIANFGQDSSFDGEKTAQGNTDANGKGDFYYSVPSGYKALCSANQPDPTIKLPNKQFDTKLWTGNGGTQNIAGLNFSPDFVWIKIRSQAYNHVLWDAVRGATLRIMSNKTNAEATNTNGLSAFNSDGYTLGDMNNVNKSGDTFVGWNWNAGESTVSNSDGSRTSSVRANPTAGFSIVTYTGNGSSGATVGHGLGVAPQVIIMKTRTSGDHWAVYHYKLGNTKIVYLNLTNSPATSSGYWNNTTPSSSVFTLGNDNKTNKSGDNYVAYCFNDVESFSKFGSYDGNNANDGTYVHLNFRPAFLMVKRTDSTRDWLIYDSARSTTNTIDDFLEPNEATAEQTSSSRSVDFLSNGFKFRNNSGDMNGSGTYIYFAFAEFPFKNAIAR